MPIPLSTPFNTLFTDKKYESLLKRLVEEFKWNCVEVFEKAVDYSSAVDLFREFYGKNLENLQQKGLHENAGNLYEALETAQSSYDENESLLLNSAANGVQKNEAINSQVYSVSSATPNPTLQSSASSATGDLTSQNLPFIQLLTRLHPDASGLFATAAFAPTMTTIAMLATVDKEDIHNPLLQLLKVCLKEKESALANKVLLLLMALKKPSPTIHNEVSRLLSADKNRLETLKDVSKIELNSFADYEALLLEAAKTNDVNHELIAKLFDIAINKATNVNELWSLASTCKNNSLLTERLAKAIATRFPEIPYLKTLMRRVNFPEVVAKVADEKITAQISSLKVFTANDYQRLIKHANYPNGVESAVKLQLTQDYFAHCQQQGLASKADYDLAIAEFVRYLSEQQSLPWFIQSVLPQIINNTSAILDLPFDKAEKFNRLAEFIEVQIVPVVTQLPELNSCLDDQRKMIHGFWLEELMACRDQLVLSDELLEQRQAWDGEDEDKQPFVSLFNEAIENIQKASIPALTELEKANKLVKSLLNAVEQEKLNIPVQYTHLINTCQCDVEALIQNQENSVQDIDKKLAELDGLRQQVLDKKSTFFATFNEIKSQLTKVGFSEIENKCQAHLATVTNQFNLMTAATAAQFKELIAIKENVARANEELRNLLNDSQPLSPQKMRMFRVKQQEFIHAKQTSNQLATQIQIQVDGAQQSLLTQAATLKDIFGQAVTDLHQQQQQLAKQKTKRQTQINNGQHRQAQIKLELQACADKASAVKENIKVAKQELKEKEEKLAELSKALEPVTRQVQQLSNEASFKASIEKLINLFNEAIADRLAARWSDWALFKYVLAEWVVDSTWLFDNWLLDDWVTTAKKYVDSDALERSLPFRVKFAQFVLDCARFMPNGLVTWGHEVMNDHNHVLPAEISQLEIELDKLNKLISTKTPAVIDANNSSSTLSTIGEQSNTYASEIRKELAQLFAQKLAIKDDKRASWIWQRSTNRAIEKFIRDTLELNKACITLTTTQVEINKLITACNESKEHIRELEQHTQNIDTLNQENDKLAQHLPKLIDEQKSTEKTLSELTLNYQQLEPLYRKVLALISSPVVDVLYEQGLNGDGKLNLLKERIEEDKSILFQEGMGDGIFANVVYHAVRQGTIEILTYILAVLPEKDRDRYLNTSIFDQGIASTPLVLALKLNDQAKINCLIQNGADLNQRLDSNDKEMSLLLWAYQQNQSEIVEALINAGADCNAQDKQGNTLLHYAAAKGDAVMVKRLLNNQNANLVDVKNQDGDDALALLIKANLSAEKKSELVPLLFARLAEPTRLSGQCFTQIDSAGNNFLHHAVANGELNLVKWLLAQPTQELINAKNHEGQTPLSLAVQAGHIAIVEFLFRQSIELEEIKEVFLAAIQQKDTSAEMIKAFLNNYQVNLLSDDVGRVLRKLTHEDPLQIKTFSYSYLTNCANFENSKLLIDSGADPRAADYLGNTVLHNAVIQGDLQKVKYLIEECGVEPHPQNNAGLTPLMALYQAEQLPVETHRQVVNYLIEKASNNFLLLGQAKPTLTQADKRGNTLLHYVAQVGDIEAVNQLIAQMPSFGANPLNQQNEVGETAAHVLVKNEILSEGVVTSVLGILSVQGKANLHLVDKEGKIPLDYATHFSVISLLLRNLPEPLQLVKLMPIALKVMATEGLTMDQRKDFIEGIAIANQALIAEAVQFYGEVSTTYYNSKKDYAARDKVRKEINVSVDKKNEYSRSFNGKSADEKQQEFRLMVIGQEAWQVAVILDTQPSLLFPAELNSQAYLSVADNSIVSLDRRNFWVRVIEHRHRKELIFQDQTTGYTLLHALVTLDDKVNFYTLNQTGVLYVTQRDNKGKTILMLAREKFSREIQNQPSYTSAATSNQSIYLSVLQSIERRLVVEKDQEIVKQIVAELNFSQLTELEMLVSLFGKLRRIGASNTDSALLWQLTDCNNKSLAESALAVLNKDPSSLRCQRVLINLLAASGAEQQNQPGLGNKLVQCQEEMKTQIQQFADQSKYNYMVSEAAIQLRVLNFDKALVEAANEMDVSVKFNALCKESGRLYKATKSKQSSSTSFFSSLVAQEVSLSPQQLQGNYAHNMVVYLGLFMEATGIDMLVTLPGRPATPCASLLATARAQQLPSLYVEIVGRVLTQLELTNPIELVKQAQENARLHEIERGQINFSRLHNSSEPVVPVAPMGSGGLRINLT